MKLSPFKVLSIVGVLVALYLVWQGLLGDGLGKNLTLFVGVFFAIKEVLDMVFAK